MSIKQLLQKPRFSASKISFHTSKLPAFGNYKSISVMIKCNNDTQFVPLPSMRILSVYKRSNSESGKCSIVHSFVKVSHSTFAHNFWLCIQFLCFFYILANRATTSDDEFFERVSNYKLCCTNSFSIGSVSKF